MESDPQPVAAERSADHHVEHNVEEETSEAFPDQEATKAAALEATKAFFASVAQAIQTPLAPKGVRRRQPAQARSTARAAKNVDTNLRRSGRLAQGNLNTVRPSKRGEVLMMRKMGILKEGELVTDEAKRAYEQIFNKPLSKKHLTAITELFPAAGCLSDEELTSTLRAGEMAT